MFSLFKKETKTVPRERVSVNYVKDGIQLHSDQHTQLVPRAGDRVCLVGSQTCPRDLWEQEVDYVWWHIAGDLPIVLVVLK